MTAMRYPMLMRMLCSGMQRLIATLLTCSRLTRLLLSVCLVHGLTGLNTGLNILRYALIRVPTTTKAEAVSENRPLVS